VLLRVLRVAAHHVVLLVFLLLILPRFSLGLLLFLLPIPRIPEVVLLKHQKNIFLGLALACTYRGCRSFLQVIDQGLLFSRGDDHVIDVDLDVSTYLTSEAILHHPLIGCSSVLEAEWHDLVTEDVVWCDKGCFSLSSFFNSI
jgi:hypothetical protein